MHYFAVVSVVSYLKGGAQLHASQSQKGIGSFLNSWIPAIPTPRTYLALILGEIGYIGIEAYINENRCTLTLLSTGVWILIVGTRSGTFHSAQTVGTSLSPTSIIMGTPSTTKTLTVSPEYSTTFMQLVVDLAGTNSLTFSSEAAGNSLCIRWVKHFLQNQNILTSLHQEVLITLLRDNQLTSQSFSTFCWILTYKVWRTWLLGNVCLTLGTKTNINTKLIGDFHSLRSAVIFVILTKRTKQLSVDICQCQNSLTNVRKQDFNFIFKFLNLINIKFKYQRIKNWMDTIVIIL